MKDIKRYVVLLVILIAVAGVITLVERIAFTDMEVREDQALLRINFIFPMKHIAIEDYVHIESKYSQSKYSYEYKWEDSNELSILIREENLPKGQTVELHIDDLPTRLLIDKCYKQNITFMAKPELVEVFPERVMPTTGPLHLVFNTLMDEEDMKEMDLGFDYDISPLKYYGNNGRVLDYSYWIVYPKEPLPANTPYRLTLNDLESQMGVDMNDTEIDIRTAMKPLLDSVDIDQGFNNASLYPKITIESNELLKKGNVKFEDIPGKVTIEDNVMTFVPTTMLDENRDYTFVAKVMNLNNEWSEEKEYEFKTMSIEDDLLWVEVALGETQEVIVRKGHEIVKQMPCSGGKADTPTVMGTYFLRDRGEKFFSRRFGEGAHYWVRITEQYLFHGIPFDKNENTIQKELDLIGQPASHGCIRLLDADAKWFYDNVPAKTMVMIHE